jgi:hypothetical protein
MDPDRFAALTRSRAQPRSRRQRLEPVDHPAPVIRLYDLDDSALAAPALPVLSYRRCDNPYLTRRRLPVYLRPLRLLRHLGIDLRRYHCDHCDTTAIIRWRSTVSSTSESAQRRRRCARAIQQTPDGLSDDGQDTDQLR